MASLAFRVTPTTLLVAMLAFSLTSGRTVDPQQRMDHLLSSPTSSSSSASSPLLSGLRGSHHALNKRAVFDSTCKGIYDREMFKRLDTVCSDCYNLYRKPEVEMACRDNCYGNLIFKQCLNDLLLEDVIDEYITIIQMVGK